MNAAAADKVSTVSTVECNLMYEKEWVDKFGQVQVKFSAQKNLLGAFNSFLCSIR